MNFDRRSVIAGIAAGVVLPKAALSAPALRTERSVAAIRVLKGKRELNLVNPSGRVLKTYPIRLGQSPDGPKRFEGDNRTPEGTYRIIERNRNSSFHLSLRVDYPSRSDLMAAARLGRPPGGDIMVHGQPNGFKGTIASDWTRGCVALSNENMEDLWKYVPVGCPIFIKA